MSRLGSAGLLRRAVLIVVGLVWLVPLYLLVVNAIRPSTAFTGTNEWTIPSSFGLFQNVSTAEQSSGLAGSLASTALYSIVSPGLAVVIGALVGFGVSVLQPRRPFFWFMVTFGGAVFPAQMLLVPLFVAYAQLNLYNTHQGLIIIYTALSVPLAALVLRNFFGGVPTHLFQAAQIDGASLWTTFWRIYIPVALSALVAVFILEFTFIWNDLLFGLTLASSNGVRPVMPALASLQSAYGGSTVPVVLAAGVVVSLPPVVVFLAAQRFFARGLALSQIAEL